MKVGLILVFVFLLSGVSATSNLNIFLDESGNALFLGLGDGGINMPEGIIYSNGRIKGETTSLTNKEGNIWEFKFELENAEMQIILPEGSRILETDGEIGIYREQFSIFASDRVSIKYVIEDVESNSLIFVLISLLILIISAIFFSKNKKKKRIHIDDLLNERERKILRELEKSGKIKSSVLRKKVEIPKASFSRHLKELEKKRLISVSGEGRNKIIEKR